MLLLVAITFVFLRAPYSLLSVIHEATYGNQYGENPQMDLALDITYCIAVLNYAINFFLFCVSGTMFRRAFVNCVTCAKIRGKNRAGKSMYMAESTMTTRSMNMSQSVSRTTLDTVNRMVNEGEMTRF